MVIKNWYYSVDGRRYWFVSINQAIKHLKETFPHIYKNCLDPRLYIQAKLTLIEIRPYVQ